MARDYGALMDDNGMALRATIIIDPNGIVQHASYNADLLGRSVSEALRLVQALQTGERCPVEWKPGAKTLFRQRAVEDSGDGGGQNHPSGPRGSSPPVAR